MSTTESVRAAAVMEEGLTSVEVVIIVLAVCICVVAVSLVTYRWVDRLAGRQVGRQTVVREEIQTYKQTCGQLGRVMEMYY